jgi:hypothetical protein
MFEYKLRSNKTSGSANKCVLERSTIEGKSLVQGTVDRYSYVTMKSVIELNG